MILLRFAFENRVVLAMVECTLTAGPELSLMLWTFISDGQVIAQYSVTWSLIDSTLQDGNSVPQLFTYMCVKQHKQQKSDWGALSRQGSCVGQS